MASLLAMHSLGFVLVSLCLPTSAHINMTSDCVHANYGCAAVPPGCTSTSPNATSRCVSAVIWRAFNDSWIEFQLARHRADGGTPQYIAMGFADEKEMGPAPVTACIFPGNCTTGHCDQNGPPAVMAAFNDKDQSNEMVDPQPSDHFELQKFIYEDDMLFCTFLQRTQPGEDDRQLPSLNDSYYLLIAFGPATDDMQLQHHSFDTGVNFPFISSEKVNFSIGGRMPSKGMPWFNLSATTIERLKDAHGALMIFAWFFCVALAVISARYYKLNWPNTMVMGKKPWFQIHRTLNSIAVLSIAAAFICILLARQQWTGVNSGSPGNHSILGLFAVLCAFVQPIMALFRGAPAGVYRPIFNWSHRILGLSSFACAAAAIWLAQSFYPALTSWGDTPNGLFIGYFGVVTAGVILLSISKMLQTLAERSKDSSSAYRRLSETDVGESKIEQYGYRALQLQPYLLGMLVLVSGVIVIYYIVIILW